MGKFYEDLKKGFKQIIAYRKGKIALRSEKNMPNAATLKAIESIEKRKALVEAKDAQDMFRKLGI